MPNIGLVLSGGFAKGAYQIGVLKALKEFIPNEQIKYISASSVGTLNAYAFAHDELDIAENMWRKLEFSGLRSFYKAYARGSYIADVVNEIASESNIPQSHLYVSCLNITNFKLNYINLKEVDPRHVDDYLLASVMIPVLSRAVEISGAKYLDGAIVDNIPVKPLLKHPLDYGIVVHFDNDNYIFENDHFDSKLIKINFLDDKIIKTSLAFDRDSISYMITSGYEKSMALFDIIFKNGTDDLEYIYQKIQFTNDLRGKKSFRLTGDVVLNNLNKAVKKIIKYKI
ncbi:MAG: patatin-like phospholipase family protein [Oscillospiraceae bacterium]|nr:patatin-like phospholipase family protein [Oscillospiraceae bacterium]